MFEILNVKSTFKVDELIRMFIQNLGAKINSPAYDSFGRVAFVTYTNGAFKIGQQLSRSTEKFNEIDIQEKWDFANENDIRRFIEKHISLLDTPSSSNNTGILTFSLKNINTRILQKVRKKRKDDENTKRIEVKTRKKRSFSSVSYKDRCLNFSKCKRNSKDVIILTNCKDNNTFEPGNRRKDLLNRNLSDGMMNVIERKTETAKNLLQLRTKDEEYLKRNMQVTLYISKKSKYNTKNQRKYNRTLCRHAILCLIEPSDKAVVLFEDDLTVVVRKYLLQGYKYKFEFQRDSEDRCVALIILNRWAKVLIDRANTTMMRTICGILGCDMREILVLYDSEEKLSQVSFD